MELVDITARIRNYRATLGLNQADFSEKIGMKTHKLADIEKGRTRPSLEVIYKIGEKFPVSVEWLIYGEEKKSRGTEKGTVKSPYSRDLYKENRYLSGTVPHGTENVKIAADGTEETIVENKQQYSGDTAHKMGYEPYDDQSVEIINTGKEVVALIPEADLDLAAGMGRYPNEHTLYIGKRPFSVDWLKRRLLNPQNLRLARVYGDSMIPLIHDKNLVMIDIKRPPSSHSPVAFRLGNNLYIKDYQLQGDGTIYMMSRNKAYDNIIIDPQNPPDDFAIIGSVVWHSHSYV